MMIDNASWIEIETRADDAIDDMSNAVQGLLGV
jgi:hypothetical protein